MSRISGSHRVPAGEIKWSRFNKFQAVSAIYFGLASAVVAQPAATDDKRAGQAAEAPRQEHFQHPILERPSSHEMQLEENRNRIQRRGMQDTIQDGEIQRNIHPGAADADPPALDRSVRDKLHGEQKGAAN